jgi:hypothetical protein
MVRCCGADHHGLAFERLPDTDHVVIIGEITRTKLGVGVNPKLDEIGHFLGLAACVANIDGKRIVCNVRNDD